MTLLLKLISSHKILFYDKLYELGSYILLFSMNYVAIISTLYPLRQL